LNDAHRIAAIVPPGCVVESTPSPTDVTEVVG
jgi:hypothetical protein